MIKESSKNIKVLIFSPEKPYTGAESFVTGKLMRAMLNEGWIVHLIYHESKLVYSPNTDTFSILKHSYGIENKLIKYLNVRFKNIPFFKNIYFLDSLLWVIRAFKLSLKLNRIEHYDLILSRIMPQYGHLPAYLFHKVNQNTPWIANWSDPLPHKKSPWPYGEGFDAKASKIAMFYLNLIIKNAAWNSFPSNRLMLYYQNYLPTLCSHNSVIPHVTFKNNNRNNQCVDPNNNIIITHVGSLGLRDPSNLIHAFTELKNQNQLKVNVRFRFIGYIDEYITILINKYGLHDFFSLEGKQSYEETLDVIRDSDMMLVIEAPLNEGIFLPSKVMDYLQYNKPILAISPTNGVMSDLLNKFGGGIAANCKSINSIKKALLIIFNEIQSVKSCEKNYNTDKLSMQFSETIVINELKSRIRK